MNHKLSILSSVLLLFCLSIPSIHAKTITASNLVIYDIVNENDHTVNISALNKSQFKERNSDLVIPAQVYDTSNAVSSDIPYNVIGFAGLYCFQDTKINSIEIQAPITELPNYTFYGCPNLKKVTLPSTVTKIGNYAFRNNTSLETIEGWDGVEVINQYAFSGCSSLDNLVFGEKLQKIYVNAFEKCTSLSAVKLPDSLTLLGQHAFEGCSANRLVEFGSGLKETAEYVFQNNTALETIVFTEGLQKIGNYAFKGCTSLKAPTFPESLITIGSASFSNCTSLGEVTIPENIEIQNYAFQESYVTDILWPSAVKSIGSGVFSRCPGLTEVTVPAYLTKISSSLFNSCPDLQKVVISEGVTEIGVSAFATCPALTTIQLPSTLRGIGNSAFASCELLEDFDFPPTMDYIDYSAFQSCKALRHLKLPAGVELIRNSVNGCKQFYNTKLLSITFPDEPMNTTWEYTVFGIQNLVEEMTFPGWMTQIPTAFCEDWDGLKKVTFKEGVETIGTRSFQKCDNISEIIFPENSLKTIGQLAFNSLTSLTAIDLPNSLETIGEEAFASCKIKKLVLPASLRNLCAKAFSSNLSMESLTLNEGLTTIGERAFSNVKLTELIWSSTIERIEANAFQYATLPELHLPESVNYVGASAFNNTHGITSVTLSPDVVYETGVFYNSHDLVSITFPETPCTFGDGTGVDHIAGIFQNCAKLTEVTLPDWLTYVPGYMFNGCTNLASVTLSPLTTEIGRYAFYGAMRLHDVEFPATLVKIGPYAFSKINAGSQYKFGPVTLYEGCDIGAGAFESTSVSEIIFMGCTNIGKDAFASLSGIERIKFPECMDTIPSGFCNSWSTLTTVELPSTVKVIGSNAFNRCSKLTSITLPEGLKEIGDSAFEYLPMTSLAIPSSVTKIGKHAFYYAKLTEFEFTDTPVELGESVFEHSNLTSITIPRWMAVIPKRAFYYCQSLNDLEFEERTADDSAPTLEIGELAFYYNKLLKTVNFPPVPTTLGGSCFYQSGVETLNFADVPYQITPGSTSQFHSCASLTEVTLPDQLEDVASLMFYSCTNLTKIKLGKEVTTIGTGAFSFSGLKEIEWSPVVASLGNEAFKSTPIESVTLPGTIKSIADRTFESCSSLKTVEIEEGVPLLSYYMFYKCESLEGITLPSSMELIASRAFDNCTGLQYCTTNEGLLKIHDYAFYKCTSLKEFTFPSTITNLGDKLFLNCDALASVTSHIPAANFKEATFKDCVSLSRFESTDSIYMLGQDCFSGCVNLKEFVYPEGLSVGYLSNRCFDGCAGLTEFPYLEKTQFINENVFRGCTGLTQMTLPGNQSNARGKLGSGMFNGATSLQSLTFPNTDRHFKIAAKDIEGAPLKALSFSYGTDTPVPGQQNAGAITAFDGRTDAVVANPEQSTLVVQRGQKWQYMDAGYGKVFNIVEEKDPQIKIEGDIFSTFDGQENVNHYQAFIRWEVPLSDLNENGSTVVEVTRDAGTDREKHVAEVVFSQPSEPIEASTLDIRDREGNKLTLDADKVIVVKVTVDGHPNDFYGDYDFLASVDANGVPTYEMRYGYESADLYFDAESHRRLVSFDAYGYTSWFVMVDKFDSPRLDEGAIPEKYVYSAVMKGYDYELPYNYDGLIPDADGNYWTTKPVELADIHSIDCTMHVAMAAPTIDGNGFYSLDEITGDTTHKLTPLTPSSQWTSKPKYTLGVDLDKDLLAQKGVDKNVSTASSYIIRSVKVIEISSGQNDTITTYTLPNRNEHQQINITNLTNVVPGKKYQTVATSLFRGTFGSPVITIPEAPIVTATMEDPSYADHFWSNRSDHDQPRMRAVSHLQPIVSGMGYEDNRLTEEDYHLGVWRTLKSNGANAPIMATSTNFSTADLLNHIEPVEDACATDCEHCDAERSLLPVEQEDGTHLDFTDVYASAYGSSYNVNYDHRLYVKVPNSMIPGATRYMLADTNVGNQGVIVSGVENVSVDRAPIDAADIRWFDLQGRPVDSPIEGQPYIRVTPAGPSKVIYQ